MTSIPSISGSQINNTVFGSSSISNLNASQTTFTQSISSIGAVKPTWDQRIIAKIDHIDSRLESALPNFFFQTKIDKFFNMIKNEFAPLTKFNKWLDSNGKGQWYKQLATLLCKLPIRAARNILKLMYTLAKAACYTVVHPLKATLKFAKLLVKLAKALSKPEVWTKLGVALIGASCGHAAIGNPLAVFGLAIGGLMTAAGLSLGALKAALQSEEPQKWKAAVANLVSQGKQIPETMLTGFFIGFLVGAIQSVPSVTSPSHLLAMGASLQKA